MKKSLLLLSVFMTGTLISSVFTGCASETEEKIVEKEVEKNHFYCPNCDAETSSKENALKHCSTVGLSSRVPVGSEIIIGGVKYYVISNNLGSLTVAARAAEGEEVSEVKPVAGETFDTGDETNNVSIEKFASDVYVRKFLKELGITKYLQVWAPAQTEMKKTSANEAYCSDKFLVIDINGNALAEFSQSWDSNMLMDYLIETGDSYASGLTKDSLKNDKSEAFLKISKKDLREKYEPTRFKISSRAGFDGGDLSKKFSVQKVYNYDENGEVALTKTNLKNKNEYKDFQNINGSKKSSYVYKEYFDNEDYNRIDYKLCRPVGNEFYGVEFYDYGEGYVRYRVAGNGDGMLNGSTNSDDRSNSVNMTFNRNEKKLVEFSFAKTSKEDGISVKYNLSVSNPDYTKSLLSQEVDFNSQLASNAEQKKLYKNAADFTKYTFAEAIQLEGIKDYIAVSDTLVKVNGMLVPSVIKIKADYKSSADFKGDYLVVTFVPDTSVTDKIVYKLEETNSVPAFIKKYSKAFANISNAPLAAEGFAVTFTADKECTSCHAKYYTESEVDACAVQSGCKGYHICTGCHTVYETDEAVQACKKQSGCAAYTVKCPVCETEYHTDEEVEACAVKIGCAAYTIAKENLAATATADFTSLTFESFQSGSLALRKNASTSTDAKDATYTPVADWNAFIDASDEIVDSSYRDAPFLKITDIDETDAQGNVSKVGKGNAHFVDGVVFWGKEVNKFKIRFNKINSTIQNSVEYIQFAGGSYGSNGTATPAVGSSIDADKIKSYIKAHTSGAGRISVTVTSSCGSSERGENDKNAFAALLDKDGKVLSVVDFKDDVNRKEEFSNENKNETLELFADVEKAQDVFIVFKKNNRVGSMNLNGVNFTAEEIISE